MSFAALVLWGCPQAPDPHEGPKDPPTTPTSPAPTTPAPTTPGPLPPPVGVTDTLHPTFASLIEVAWRQDAAADAHVEYAVDGGHWRSTPARPLAAGPHVELLLGVPYDADVAYRVVLTRGAERATSPDASARAGELPDGVPLATVVSDDPSRADPTAPYVLTSLGELGSPFWVVLLDRDARVVWAYRSHEGRVSLHPRVARDGASLLVDQDSFWGAFDGGAASTVEQLRLDGTTVHTFATPGLHHTFTDLPGGSIAWTATDGAYSDETVRVVHADGAVEDRFACGAWLATVGGGTCAANTISYDDTTDRFLLSLFSIETVVELDATTGEVTRWFGHLDGSWAFDPPSSAFWWQHGAYVTPAGTLLTSSDRTEHGGETIVREYTLDESARTLREVWSAGLGAGVYGQYAGEAVRLDGGNTLHDYGELARLREFAPDGTVVRDLVWDGASYIGRSSGVADLYALLPDRP